MQIVSGTKISKITKDTVDKPVRFVNILTDIYQRGIDIYQSVNYCIGIGVNIQLEKVNTGNSNQLIVIRLSACFADLTKLFCVQHLHGIAREG